MVGSFNHDDDPNTTNLFIGNIHPTVNENDLCDVFTAYGPLASVKIMWPRTDEERARNRNSGFVAYMIRQDAELAIKSLIGCSIKNYDLRLGWAKQVIIPPMPIAYPDARRADNAKSLLSRPNLDSMQPSSSHNLKQTASQSSKSSSKFSNQEPRIEKKDKLNGNEVEHLDMLLNKLSTKRKSIGHCMLYCINHSYAAQDVINKIYDSILKSRGEMVTNFKEMLAKVYLISDILHNCSAQVPNASYYRGGFKSKLMEIFSHVASKFVNISESSRLNESKEKILTIFKAWKDWTLYEDEFLVELSGIALGITKQLNQGSQSDGKVADVNSNESKLTADNATDLDGTCMNEEQLERCLIRKGFTLSWYKSLGLMEECRVGVPTGQPVVSGAPCGPNFDEVDFPRLSEEISLPCKVAQVTTADSRSIDTDEWKAKRAAFKTTKWDTIDPDEETSDDNNIHVTSLSDYHDISDQQAAIKVDGDNMTKRGCEEESESASKSMSPSKRAKLELKEEGEIIDSSSDDDEVSSHAHAIGDK